MTVYIEYKSATTVNFSVRFVFITLMFCVYYCNVLCLLLSCFVFITVMFCVYYCHVLYLLPSCFRPHGQAFGSCFVSNAL